MGAAENSLEKGKKREGKKSDLDHWYIFGACVRLFKFSELFCLHLLSW